MKTLCLTCVFGLVVDGTVKGYEGCEMPEGISRKDRDYVVTKCTFGSVNMSGTVVNCNKYEKEELGKIKGCTGEVHDVNGIGVVGFDEFGDKWLKTGIFSPWCQCPSCMEKKSGVHHKASPWCKCPSLDMWQEFGPGPKGWEEW